MYINNSVKLSSCNLTPTIITLVGFQEEHFACQFKKTFAIDNREGAFPHIQLDLSDTKGRDTNSRQG